MSAIRTGMVMMGLGIRAKSQRMSHRKVQKDGVRLHLLAMGWAKEQVERHDRDEHKEERAEDVDCGAESGQVEKVADHAGRDSFSCFFSRLRDQVNRVLACCKSCAMVASRCSMRVRAARMSLMCIR